MATISVGGRGGGGQGGGVVAIVSVLQLACIGKYMPDKAADVLQCETKQPTAGMTMAL